MEGIEIYMEGIEMLKKSIALKYAVLPMYISAGIGLSPVSAYASTIALSDTSNLRISSGKPDNVPPANPPIDTPAFYNGLVNAPTTMPPSVPSHTLPGSGFGQAAIPIPAAVWLFGSGLLGLIGVARKKAA
jgi:hypothetical protein